VSRDEQKLSTTGRRGFLRGLVATGASAAAVSLVVGSDAASASTETAPDRPANAKGYQVTRHVLEYYRTASF